MIPLHPPANTHQFTEHTHQTFMNTLTCAALKCSNNHIYTITLTHFVHSRSAQIFMMNTLTCTHFTPARQVSLCPSAPSSPSPHSLGCPIEATCRIRKLLPGVRCQSFDQVFLRWPKQAKTDLPTDTSSSERGAEREEEREGERKSKKRAIPLGCGTKQ